MSIFYAVNCRRLAVVAFLGLAAQLAAQQALYVEYKDKAYAVRKVHNGWVTINVAGKPVTFPTARSVLQPVEEYLPVFIAVKDVKARGTGQFTGSSQRFNNTFHFDAEFTSPQALSDVFLVMEMDWETAGQRLYLYEVGDLKPGTPRRVTGHMHLGDVPGKGNYQWHLFAGGLEVFHSKQPAALREAALDRMVQKRISGEVQAQPRPFVAPEPAFPEQLRKSGRKGDAEVIARITVRGAVMDPVLISASDPAFGEAALTAVRQWRFLPQVKDGHPVEAKVSIPFAFTPPKRASAEKD